MAKTPDNLQCPPMIDIDKIRRLKDELKGAKIRRNLKEFILETLSEAIWAVQLCEDVQMRLELLDVERDHHKKRADKFQVYLMILERMKTLSRMNDEASVKQHDKIVCWLNMAHSTLSEYMEENKEVLSDVKRNYDYIQKIDLNNPPRVKSVQEARIQEQLNLVQDLLIEIEKEIEKKLNTIKRKEDK